MPGELEILSESKDMSPVYEPEVEAPSESGTSSSAETSDEEGDGPEELYFVVVSDPTLCAEQTVQSDIVRQRCQALRKNYAYDLPYHLKPMANSCQYKTSIKVYNFHYIPALS